MVEEPPYLKPYLKAAERYGDGFGSLLWASPRTQNVRFHALLRAYDFGGRSVLDVGCGRGDLLRFAIELGHEPSRYVGIEAVPDLAAAVARDFPEAELVRRDFVLDPAVMDVDADVIVFCGSLNTLTRDQFVNAIGAAAAYARRAVVFNFLSSTRLASQSHLTWHDPATVVSICRERFPLWRLFDDYLPGDATVVGWKDTP